MALTVRKRGEVWHARGTIRVGRETISVAEHSTGARARNDALRYAEAEEARIRAEHLEGDAGRARRLTLADAFGLYLSRAGGLKRYDVGRIGDLNEAIGARPISAAAQAWQEWLTMHPGHAPATVARWRAVYLAALRAGCDSNGLPVPKIPTVRQRAVEKVVYLTQTERRDLLAAYNPYAAAPVLLLAYQGMRTQEVLRLDWRQVDVERRTIHLRAERTKSGKGRAIPMHPRVDALLLDMWHSQGMPQLGAVFRSSRGVPYADTRGRGGNPLKRAHETACRAAKVKGFRVHDWRHDWAARMVMAGVDLVTLMRLGGWATLSMVQRYASVSAEHLRDAVAKAG